MPPDMPSPTLIRPSSRPLRLGTRGSRLALAQSRQIAAALTARAVAVEILVVKTSGDRIQDRPLAEFGGKALFAKELEEALLLGQIDLAVHSLKDLPAILPDGLQVCAVPQRASPFDTLVLPAGVSALARPPRVGTCSVRRTAQIRRAYPDAEVLSLRGNVDTRLKKLDDGQYDAVVLSAAGLQRLDLGARIGPVLLGERWLPALGQGALGIETRIDDAATNAVVSALDDAPSHLAAACERAFQNGLNGNCHSPIAGLAEIRAATLFFRGEVLAHDGSQSVSATFSVPLRGDGPHDMHAVRTKALAEGARLRPAAMKWL